MSEVSDINKRLADLQRRLDTKQLRYAIKDTLRAESKIMRKAVVAELSEALPGKKYLNKNIRSGVSRDCSQAYVSVRPYGVRNMHRNRFGQLKPIAFWLNNGVSAERSTRKHRTGGIEGKAFVEKAESRYLNGAPDRIAEGYRAQIEKQARKAGLI